MDSFVVAEDEEGFFAVVDSLTDVVVVDVVVVVEVEVFQKNQMDLTVVAVVETNRLLARIDSLSGNVR